MGCKTMRGVARGCGLRSLFCTLGGLKPLKTWRWPHAGGQQRVRGRAAGPCADGDGMRTWQGALLIRMQRRQRACPHPLSSLLTLPVIHVVAFCDNRGYLAQPKAEDWGGRVGSVVRLVQLKQPADDERGVGGGGGGVGGGWGARRNTSKRGMGKHGSEVDRGSSKGNFCASHKIGVQAKSADSVVCAAVSWAPPPAEKQQGAPACSAVRSRNEGRQGAGDAPVPAERETASRAAARGRPPPPSCAAPQPASRWLRCGAAEQALSRRQGSLLEELEDQAVLGVRQEERRQHQRLHGLRTGGGGRRWLAGGGWRDMGCRGGRGWLSCFCVAPTPACLPRCRKTRATRAVKQHTAEQQAVTPPRRTMSLMRMLSDGPLVSLSGSPTVSPITAAWCRAGGRRAAAARLSTGRERGRRQLYSATRVEPHTPTAHPTTAHPPTRTPHYRHHNCTHARAHLVAVGALAAQLARVLRRPRLDVLFGVVPRAAGVGHGHSHLHAAHQRARQHACARRRGGGGRGAVERAGQGAPRALAAALHPACAPPRPRQGRHPPVVRARATLALRGPSSLPPRAPASVRVPNRVPTIRGVPMTRMPGGTISEMEAAVEISTHRR